MAFKETPYSEKLKDPRWQKKRLEILSRDEWACQACGDEKSMLVIHHRFYEKGDPWETGDYALVTLCQACHDHEHDSYPEYAKTLIEVIKAKGFLADQAFTLVDAFDAMPVINAPEYMASLIEFALTDMGTLQMIIKRFDKATKAKIAKRKKAAEAAKAENPLAVIGG